MTDAAGVRAWLREELEEDREQWRGMTYRDYVWEAVKMFLGMAVIYRVTAQTIVAGAAGVDLHEHEPEWTAFDPVFPELSRRLDMAGRLCQSAFWLFAAASWMSGFGGGLGSAVVVATNVAVLIFDPAIFATDYVIHYAQDETH